ncbi:MAG: ADP-ribosylation factor-like protein [Clostridia bacterium]|nr:ADP-ribosylation factor-like protein [Clostridia bacterium]
MTFREKIRQALDDMPKEKIQFFAWLCAVRALPFLGIEEDFSFWPKARRREFLYSLFHAMDYAANAAADVFSDSRTVSYATGAFDAATAADAIATAAALTAALADAELARGGATGIAHSAAVAVYASFAAAADAADAVATRVTVLVDTLTEGQRFERLVLDDLRYVAAGDLDNFDHDPSLYTSRKYGDVWKNFEASLQTEECGYWARLYTDIFSNRFKIDRDKLAYRLSVPPEIMEQGAAAVAEHLENAEKQGQVVYTQRETRLIILGSAGAGKTTLVRRLNGDTSYPDPEESTHGVDTSIKLDFDGTKAHIWDFGGQVIYHASHRCFMSANCVYILVVNARTEDNRDTTRINYWLDTIRVYSKNKAKVFIVINESDNRKQSAADYDTFKDGEYGSLIQDFYCFNIGKNMNGVEGLKKELAAYIEAFGHQSFGIKDSNAMEELIALLETKRKVLERGELEAVLRDSGIQTRRDQKRAIELLHVLGRALSYDFMEDYVLDPYWISRGVYKVIDHLQRTKAMFIEYNDLDEVFARERDVYPEEKRKYILDLMAHYKIGFRNEEGVRGLIVPCAASQFKPKKTEVGMEPDNLITRVERDELQEFPADFFYRYICANKDDIKKDGQIWAMWQTGMVLAGECASALVELKAENRRIEITVWGERKEEYRKVLVSLLDALLKEYHFTPHSERRRDKDGKLMDNISLVVEAAAKGATKAVIEGSSGSGVKSLWKRIFGS